MHGVHFVLLTFLMFTICKKIAKALPKFLQRSNNRHFPLNTIQGVHHLAERYYSLPTCLGSEGEGKTFAQKMV